MPTPYIPRRRLMCFAVHQPFPVMPVVPNGKSCRLECSIAGVLDVAAGTAVALRHVVDAVVAGDKLQRNNTRVGT